MNRGWKTGTPQDHERRIQAKIVQIYRVVGCVVYNLSQARASHQTPGLPDLWVVSPMARIAWWHEVKTPLGRQSAAQRRFQSECEETGMSYVLGGLDAAKAHLLAVGLARVEQGEFVLQRRFQ